MAYRNHADAALKPHPRRPDLPRFAELRAPIYADPPSPWTVAWLLIAMFVVVVCSAAYGLHLLAGVA